MIMANWKRFDKAETIRYAKIQNIINLLQGSGNVSDTAVFAAAVGYGFPGSFHVGRRIIIEDEKIRIGRNVYYPCELKKVTINTEGSMAVYGREGKKLCGSLSLNVSVDNIEMFCVWVWKNNIFTEVISGKNERFFQYLLLGVAAAAVLIWKMIR